MNHQGEATMNLMRNQPSISGARAAVNREQEVGTVVVVEDRNAVDDQDDGEDNNISRSRKIQAINWEDLLSSPNVVLPYNSDKPGSRGGRMHLLRNEKQWGMAIKESIENDPELNKLSDYFYAQLGIVEMENGDNMDHECVLQRIRALQDLKQEYDIFDTVEDAIKSIRDYMELFPNWFIHLVYDDKMGGFVVVCDVTRQANLRSVRSNPNGAKILTKGVYYFNHAFASDFEAIRRGVTFTVECEGSSLSSTSVDMATMRIVCDVYGHYPWKLNKAQFFNCGVLMKLLLSMSKPFIPQKFREKHQFGFTSPERLDQLLMVPTKEDARQRILTRFEEALRRRYQNEASFSFA